MWNDSRLPLIVLLVFIDSVVRAEMLISPNNNTPHNALECYSSSSPNKSILCPVDRSAFCVKEVASSSRQYCGRSEDHPFDVWDIKARGGLCVYTKCSSECLSNETSTFENQGESHTRSAFCCSESLCNSSLKLSPLRSAGFVGVVVTILFIMLDA